MDKPEISSEYPGRPKGVSPELWAELNRPAEHSETITEAYAIVPQDGDASDAVQAVASDDPDLLGSLDFGGQLLLEEHPDATGLDESGRPLDARV